MTVAPSSMAADPGLLASLLQLMPSQQYYYPQMVNQAVLVQHLALQAKLAAQHEVKLVQVMEACQSSETSLGMEARREMVQELDILVKQWVRSEGLRQGLNWTQVEKLGGNVVTYGSFRLGVVDRDSDLDLLAVVPRHVTRDDFFQEFYMHLAKRPEVSELRALSKAYVPVIKFKYKDIDVDLTVARLMGGVSLPDSEDYLTQDAATRDLDPRCLRSLNGYRATRELLQLVPDVAKFQTVLRLVKLWARRQGIYGNMLGFLGGASWAILVTSAAKMEAERQGQGDNPVHLVYLFFKVRLQTL